MVRTAIARLAAVALAAALPTAILHAEAALPGESCCDIRTVSPKPEKCCNGGIIARYESYSTVRDCDDRQGWRTTDTIRDYMRTEYEYRQLTESVRAGYYRWVFYDDGGWSCQPAEAGAQGAFWHDGRCTCVTGSTIANERPYIQMNVVTKCTGGQENYNILEQWIGDI
jgi:hypothetical protein